MSRLPTYPAPDLPPGYEQVWIASGKSLVLPAEAAAELSQMMRLREDQATDHLRAQLPPELAAVPSRKARSVSDGNRLQGRRRYGRQPKPGWYRVLPGLAEIEKALKEGRAAVSHSDKDLTERLRLAREAMVKRGPDRRCSLPAQWRQRLDRLQNSLPHFSQPIDLVRGALALAEASGKAVRIPPMLLLGPAGVGKTHFSHELAAVLDVPHGAVPFDQPSYGGQLRGTDSAWSNTQTGLLFNMVCDGEHANPVILLDELDKACYGGRDSADPIAQLHGALEPVSARRTVDVSVHVEFDASMVTYIATANSIVRLSRPILSRFEIFSIAPPSPCESVVLARDISAKAIERLALGGKIDLDRLAICALAHLSPRQMIGAVEKAIAAVVIDGRQRVTEDDVWMAMRVGSERSRLH